MTHFIAKAALAALVAMSCIPVTVSFAAEGRERAAIVDVQYRPVHGCSPIQAVQKARWSGMRNARVTGMTPRRVVVSGRDYRGWDRMVFANVRGCPQIRR